jgi:hypothetical protein
VGWWTTGKPAKPHGTVFGGPCRAEKFWVVEGHIQPNSLKLNIPFFISLPGTLLGTGRLIFFSFSGVLDFLHQ